MTLPPNTPRSYLTLSAAGDLLPEDARSAAVIDRKLADGDTEGLIDYVWPATEPTEAEARLAWGDR